MRSGLITPASSFMDYPKWIYHPAEEAKIIESGPIPKGWYEEPVKRKSVDEMSKEELDLFAKEMGIELDRRKSKANMLKDFEELIDDGSGTNTRSI